MVVPTRSRNFSRKRNAYIACALMLLISISPMVSILENTGSNSLDDSTFFETSHTIEPWLDGAQPWPQSSRTPGREALPPIHSPAGGAGIGAPADASELMSIIDPALNWQYGSYIYSTDSFATPIADLSSSLESDVDSIERCGGNSLYTILIQTESVGGSDHSILRIIEGEDADLAWEVDLGSTEEVKAAPVIVDIDDDGKQEIIVAYDSGGTFHVEAYSPSLECTVTGWNPGGGHATELLWTYTDESLMISSTEGPYASSWAGGHKPTTQPLLADLDLDGTAELVISAIDENSEDPVVLALDLTASAATLIWSKTLDKGTHPSDPTFVQTDENTAYVLLTSIQTTSSSMWIWKLDSDDGDANWDGKSLENLNGFDSSAPHIRLPGPVLANLDSDSDMEMVVTIPTDFDDNNAADGAEFYGLEISDGTQIWDFEASNGFADAPPIVIDTDGDGDHDRVCWITWGENNLANRDGYAGCHEDTDTTNPQEAFSVEILDPTGAPNDGIAVAAPIWMDIDGTGEPELLVPYGRELRVYDGELGTMAAVNPEWNAAFDIGHRTWSSPALADIDGDATLDLVLGDTVVSLARADVRPLQDGRGIEFNPTAPDPGETVTVTAFFENAGTTDTDRNTDAILYANGIEIATERIGTMQPVDPSGGGSFSSFSVEWIGDLGEHTFELVLDPWSNLSQTRVDNDAQITILSIVPPYNATFEMATEPVRVTPGQSSVAMPNIRSTGRLAGTWSLTVDDSNLPAGWSWFDETTGGLSGIEISANEIWTPNLRIHAPSNALGSDAGYLSLTITLDEDTNISVTAALPIEANRTRGLSVRGPDGTSNSLGYGLLGEDAKAWILVHNLGNAAENQITMSWDNTAWGSDLRLYDLSGNEITALTLEPDEVILMTARIGVPNNANLGDYVSTPFELCVGTEEGDCQSISLQFEAAGVVMDVHQRSDPDSILIWNLAADMPGTGQNSTTQLEWSLADAGMVISGWSWSATDDLAISGDSMRLTRSGSTRVYGSLTLELPPAASPAFHSFFDSSEQSSDHSIDFSLEVLQIYRASLSVTSPVDQPHEVEVNEDVLVMLRLENQGNGDDNYQLSHQIILDSNLTEDPGITVSFSSEIVTLGAGSLRTVPVIVVLPTTTPAATPIQIRLEMTSIGNSSIDSSEIVILEARQDHRWGINAEHDGSNISGATILVNPGNATDIEINARNIGNMEDDLEIQSSINIVYSGSDSSTGWSAESTNASSVAVNASTSLTISVTSPDEAWNGSKMEVDLTIIARGEIIEIISFKIEIAHIQSWTAHSNYANLEIDPEGSTIQMTIVQEGNAPSRAYPTVYVNGSNGWVVEFPDELPILEPGESAPMYLNITPPSNAQYGRTVELHLRLREGGSLSETIVPLRVAVIHDFTLEGQGPWIVSEDGGYPHAFLTNNGNAPTTITLNIGSLPSGWIVSGETNVVLGVGQMLGLPIEIIPSANWQGEEYTIRIEAEDNSGNIHEILLDTAQQSHSWGTSPIISAIKGDMVSLKIHGTDSTSTVIDDSQGQLSMDDQGWRWLATQSNEDGEITIDSSEGLIYISMISNPSQRSATCSISGTFNSTIAFCEIHNGTERFEYTILLIDDEGRMLDSVVGIAEVNQSSGQINLTSTGWSPNPGIRTLRVRVLDSRGIETHLTETNFEVRRNDWNVGLTGIEALGSGENQKIRVTTVRDNQHLLSNADCSILVTVGDYSAIHTIDASSVYLLPTIDRPDIADGEEIVIRFSCKFPWDIESDSSDNEVRMILSNGYTQKDSIADWTTGIAAALLVIGVSISMVWITKNYREKKMMMQMTEAAIKQKFTKKNELSPTPSKLTETNDEISQSIDDEQPEEEMVKNDDEFLDEFERRLNQLGRKK